MWIVQWYPGISHDVLWEGGDHLLQIGGVCGVINNGRVLLFSFCTTITVV